MAILKRGKSVHHLAEDSLSNVWLFVRSNPIIIAAAAAASAAVARSPPFFLPPRSCPHPTLKGNNNNNKNSSGPILLSKLGGAISLRCPPPHARVGVVRQSRCCKQEEL